MDLLVNIVVVGVVIIVGYQAYERFRKPPGKPLPRFDPKRRHSRSRGSRQH